MSLYHTCPKCGANLDPGEHCDCEKMKYTFVDNLIVGFDNAQNGDHIVLTIGRKIGNRLDILNSYQDDEAKDMYFKLITQAPEGLIKHIL